MAQQIFDQYAPLAKVSANETIPVVAAIAQTRDGKDELLHGTVPFVPAGGLYVPVSAANRLPVEATLTGSLGAGLRRLASTGAIDPSQTKVVLDIPAGQAVEILSMEVTSLTDNLRVRVRTRSPDGELSAIPLIVLGGGGYSETPTLSHIRQHGMSLWEFSTDQPGLYKIRSTFPLPMPNGGDIALINQTESSISGGAVVVWREL